MNRTIDKDTLLSVVAPVYNEQSGIVEFVDEVLRHLRDLPFPGQIELVLVNDGSSDGSAAILDSLAASNPGEIAVIHLARNFGHGAAISAGLDHCKGNAVILMDSDMQDDPVAFAEFVEKWREGYDVVYAQRTSRQESFVSRLAFWTFYRLLGWIASTPMPPDAGTYGLMDRRAVDHLRHLPERNRYWPGLRAWIGLKQTGIPVPRRARYDRSSRVGLRGLWTLAMNAIFSFSYVPIFVFRALGLMALLSAFLLICFVLYHKLFTGEAVTAWASQMTAIAFFGGMSLLGIGIVGEYVARIYDEIKGRPAYVVDRITGMASQRQ